MVAPNCTFILLLMLLLSCNLSSDKLVNDKQENEGANASISLLNASNQQLKIKKHQVFKHDLAEALGLNPEHLCFEQEEFSCIDDVHVLELGGVSPYEKGIHTPMRKFSASTPLIVERVVLSACSKRSELDLADQENALIFRQLNSDKLGNLLGEQSEALKQAVNTLAHRSLQRALSQSELDTFFSLYEEVIKKSDNKQIYTWAVLSCYIMLSSLEFLFY